MGIFDFFSKKKKVVEKPPSKESISKRNWKKEMKEILEEDIPSSTEVKILTKVEDEDNIYKKIKNPKKEESLYFNMLLKIVKSKTNKKYTSKTIGGEILRSNNNINIISPYQEITNQPFYHSCMRVEYYEEYKKLDIDQIIKKYKDNQLKQLKRQKIGSRNLLWTNPNVLNIRSQLNIYTLIKINSYCLVGKGDIPFNNFKDLSPFTGYIDNKNYVNGVPKNTRT